MNLSIFTTDESCALLLKEKIYHVTMFEKHQLQINCSEDTQLLIIAILIKHYVKFMVQGKGNISIITESDNYQRVRFRFD